MRILFGRETETLSLFVVKGAGVTVVTGLSTVNTVTSFGEPGLTALMFTGLEGEVKTASFICTPEVFFPSTRTPIGLPDEFETLTLSVWANSGLNSSEMHSIKNPEIILNKLKG